MNSLKLRSEKRSSVRLEVVIPTLNEERRLAPLLEYLSTDFDIVLLDGGSTDGTMNIAQSFGATVFERVGNELTGEKYFEEYCKFATLSGRVFWLFSDEFVSRIALKLIDSDIQQKAGTIWAERIDWAFGRRIVLPGGRSLRGGLASSIKLDVTRLHGSLVCDAGFARHIVDVEHFSEESVCLNFGKVGDYVDKEVRMFRKAKKGSELFVRRYILGPGKVMLLRPFVKNNQSSFALFLHAMMMNIAVLAIAVVAVIEQRLLPGLEETRKLYRERFVGFKSNEKEDQEVPEVRNYDSHRD